MAAERVEWLPRSRRESLVSMFPNPIVPIFIGLVFSLTTKVVALTYVLRDRFDLDFALELYGAALLPLVSPLLAQFTDFFQYQWWVWYVLVFSWFGVALSVAFVLVYVRADGTDDVVWVDSLHVLGVLLGLLFIGHTIVAGVVSGLIMVFVAGGVDMVTYSKLFLTMRLSWLSIPLGVSVPAFGYSPVVWLIILVYWFLQSSGDVLSLRYARERR